MASITIDNFEYDLEKLKEEAKEQVASLRFCDVVLQRLQLEAMSMQMLRNAYSDAIKTEIDKMEAAASIRNEPASPPVEADKKKGLLSGFFGKS